MTAGLLFILLSGVPAGTVIRGSAEVSAGEMIEDLMAFDGVFIGEKHDDPLAHEWELFIWNALADQGRVLALEMFETDVQDVLYSYLAGEISEEEFLETSRPWGNYSADYAPLVESARERGLRVIAANVPRRYAAMVASGGWEAIRDLPFFGELVIDSSSVFYRDKFMATMEAMGGGMHGMPMDHGNMYRAQLLKDAVMASSVAGERFVFICGSFHSDHHSGIPDQLPGDVSIATVKILPEGEEFHGEAADYVIVR